MRRHAIVLGLALALTLPRGAVVTDSGAGTGKTAAPSPDPGWANVGIRDGLNGVYLGYGWVLTASHVGAGPIEIGGTTYPELPGSTVWIQDASSTYADLIAYRIHPSPRGVAALEIPTSTPPVGTDVRLIGWGLSRGDATLWNDIGGWLWGTLTQKRWGTNRVGAVLTYSGSETNFTYLTIGSTTTRALVADFTQGAPNQEAIVAVGDS